MPEPLPGAATLPPDAARLRVDLPSPYVYKSSNKRRLARLLDLAGSLMLGGPVRRPHWDKASRVAVLRLDHLGDLLHALPAIRRIRKALPSARLDLWVGPWGVELAGLFADVDRVQAVEADWFLRPHRVEWPWGQILGLSKALRTEAYDAAFELRGDLRHHLALWGAGIPVRAGQAVTAGGFLLTNPAVWKPELHEQEQSLSLLDQAFLPSAEQGTEPYLRFGATAQAEASRVAEELGLERKPVLIQAACGTLAKRWDPKAWAKVIDGLPRGLPIGLLGSRAEREEMKAIAALCREKVAVAAGELSLSGLAALISRSRLVMSVDSGPAHLAAVQGVKVLALYSGTNRAAQWAPRGPGVKLLQAEGFPCSPCELTECPYNNACMQSIDPETVLARAWEML